MPEKVCGKRKEMETEGTSRDDPIIQADDSSLWDEIKNIYNDIHESGLFSKKD